MKKFTKKVISIFLLLTMLTPTWDISPALAEEIVEAEPATQIEMHSVASTIEEIYTDKAAYQPGDTAIITLQILNPTDAEITEVVHLSISHMAELVYETTTTTTIEAMSTGNISISWPTPPTDYMGYLVNASLTNGSSRSTAIDVSSDFTRYPRYGYSVDFPVGEIPAESAEIIEDLARNYHINVVQYYDWMYRHEKDVPAGDTWVDMFGNTISKASIMQRIAAGHEQNQRSMAYQMAYMAREGYENYGVLKKWGLYRNKEYNTSYDPEKATTISNLDQLNFPLEGNPAPILNVFNPLNKDWQDFMAQQYTDSINKLGFDGIHVDQMGNFWGDISYYDYYGNYVDLGKTFSSFINNSKRALTANNADKDYITMNMVNGGTPSNDSFSSWDITKNSDTDFAFSELWENSDTYNSLKNFVDWERANSDGKTMVLAAYMNQKDNYGASYAAKDGFLNGVITGSDTGITYVTGFDQPGDCVEWTVTVPEDGEYALVFHYSNGAEVRATKKIYVDDVQMLQANFDCTRPGLIPAQPSWSSYSYEAAFTDPKLLYLTAGTHTIKISHDVDSAGDIRLESLTLGTYDINSVRLTNAAIAASGAMHIEMGTGMSMAGGTEPYSDPVMLGHPYYPKAFKTMCGDLKKAMKAHYNFITAYENLLYDPDVIPSDGGLQNITIAGHQVSGSGEPGKIWFIPKNKSDKYGILHLINLTGENDTNWRNPTATPSEQTDLSVKYYIPDYKSVGAVYVASPDQNDSKSVSLSFSTGTDANGKYVEFTVPSLKYWDMVYFDWDKEKTPQIIEAEDSILSGVSFNNNHSGYTGRGFVDQFGDLYDSVTTDIVIPSDGIYTLKFRFANSTGAECSRELFVDNASVGKVTFLSGNDWDTWQTAEKGVTLKAGQHRLVLLVTDAYGGFINLDNISVTPLHESVRALYMNNWNNTNYIWKDTEVNRVQPPLNDGPSIYEMRFYNGTAEGDYNTNQIKNYSMFFRDETEGKAYTQGAKFRSTGYFNENGVLHTHYDTYDGTQIPADISRSYAVIPNENFMLVEYTITNNTNVDKQYSILDMLHVNNDTQNSISAQYNVGTRTISYDMSAAGQYYMAHGTLESSIDAFQVANDSDVSLSSMTCSPWVTFDSDGLLKENSSVTTKNISSGLKKTVSLAAGETRSIYFYTAICATQGDLDATIQLVQSKTPQQWMTIIGDDYHEWLASGKQTNLEEQRLNDAYDRLLITLKQSIVPGSYTDATGKTINKFAAMPATTNPAAYSYKIWARDSAVSAMAMDASGHLDEAEAYWRWLAERQIKTDQGEWKKPGAFWTCHWIWDNSEVSFVEPEYDSIGMFLVGAYRHYQALTGAAKQEFLNDIWDSYKLSADLVMNSIGDSGLGAADCSIWEEQFEYNTFTQGLYVAGLDAAQEMAMAKGLQEIADAYNGAAGTIRSSIQRSVTDNPIGLHNQQDLDSDWWYYNRAVNLDGTQRNTVDSSSNILFTYGVFDMASKRSYDHYRKVTATIGHDEYGIARYQGDTFYTGKNSWDPGGPEALEDEPSWPQMTMWVAMMELNSGYDGLVRNGMRRLGWYVDRTAAGYMPAGEAISNITYKPMISTAAEPITAAAYIMTALAYDEQFDMRVRPTQFNAGANKTINVNPGCVDASDPYNTVADWQQWSHVPYYLDSSGDSSGDLTHDISRVYIANDADNIYLRIDNVGKTLSEFNTSENKFSIAVYAEDFKHMSHDTSSTSVNGTSLQRDASFAFVRKSDSNIYEKLEVSNGQWTVTKQLTTIAPQWESNSGRIEMVIPKSELSSTGTTDFDDWGNLVILLGTQEASEWTDCDSLSIHYRITAPGTAWIFGNSEQ